MVFCSLISARAPQLTRQDGGLPAEGWQLLEDAIITPAVSVGWLGPQPTAPESAWCVCVWRALVRMCVYSCVFMEAPVSVLVGPCLHVCLRVG